MSDAEGQAAASASMDREVLLRLENLLSDETRGEFEIIRQLGRGGMAVVFLAREVHLARLVAIKVLPPELTFGHGVERFKREARTAAALDHPHIIPIYRVGTGGVLFWYAMKYIEGHSLDEVLLQRGRLSVEETLGVLSQVAQALDHAHEHGVIHRDVKPANVLLDSHDRAIVTDFGIAKALSANSLTASGSMVGTPYFMSPEQWLGTRVTGASDQYSVAVMAYRMLSGHVPFEGESAIEILQKHCTAPVPPLDIVAPGLPRHVYRAIHRALEKKPERRFSSVGRFVDALRDRHGAPTLVLNRDAETVPIAPSPATPGSGQRGQAEKGVGKAPSPRVVVHTPLRRPRWRRTGSAFALLVVGSAAGAFWYVQSRGGLTSLRGQLPWLRSSPAVAPNSIAVGGPAELEGSGVPVPGGAVDSATPADAGSPSEAEPLPAEANTSVRPRTGTVVVEALPRGGTILAAGRRRGSIFELPPGEHEIQLSAPGFQAQREQVKVIAGDSVRLPFAARRLTAARPRTIPSPRDPPPPAVLRLQVRPPARILIDNIDFGERSQLVHSVGSGAPHQLSFVPLRSGYLRKDTTLTVRAGDTVTVLIRLETEQ